MQAIYDEAVKIKKLPDAAADLDGAKRDGAVTKVIEQIRWFIRSEMRKAWNMRPG